MLANSILFKTTRSPKEAGINNSKQQSNSKQPKDSDDGDFIGSRLHNIGFNCYANASLQCMFYTAPLISKLRNVNCSRHSITTQDFCILNAFKRLFCNCIKYKLVFPKEFILNLKSISSSFCLGQQEDAQEFLIQVLNKIDDCTRNGSNESIITKVFGCYSVTKLICCGCKRGSSNHASELMLVLGIQNVSSLMGALQLYVRPELFEGRCERCNCNARIRQTMIGKASEVIMFQLSRFSLCGSEKLCEEVEYPLQLDIRPFMMDETEDGLETEYELYAVLVHVGSIECGHYFSYVRSSDVWIRKNDSESSIVSEEEVLNQCAYLLFYVKKGSLMISRSFMLSLLSNDVCSSVKKSFSSCETDQCDEMSVSVGGGRGPSICKKPGEVSSIFNDKENGGSGRKSDERLEMKDDEGHEDKACIAPFSKRTKLC